MRIDELRKYEENYNDDNIAKKLIELSKLTDEKDLYAIQNDLENALYQLKAMAENNYNADYWRTLYNVLLLLTE